MGPGSPKKSDPPVDQQVVLENLYAELRSLAAAAMSSERPEHTMQPTELVHEAWLRLIKSRALEDSLRPQFMAMAATAMRRILIEHARMRTADKRSRQRSRRLEFDPVEQDRAGHLLTIDEHLEQLKAQDQSLGRIVELRFFAGLNVEETAAAMEISPRTVKRGWRLARAWLQSKIENEEGHGS